MLRDKLIYFQFQDPQEKENSNFDWSLDLDEVDFNHKLIGYPEETPLKEELLFMDILNDERDENNNRNN